LKNKTLPDKEREMKRVSDAGKPPVVVPVVVVAVDVHVALVVPAVERGKLCDKLSVSPPFDLQHAKSQDCI
jgi:hypothetical protein